MAAKRLRRVDGGDALQHILTSTSSGDSDSDDLGSESDILDTFTLNSSSGSDTEGSNGTSGNTLGGAATSTQRIWPTCVDWDWTPAELQPASFPFTGNCDIKASIDGNSTELDIFQLFVTPELLVDIATESNLYFSQNPQPKSSTRHDLPFSDTTAEELKVFLAVSIMMGVVRKPELHLYWSRDGMLETPFFRKTMPRDRYTKMMANLHFKDNTLDDGSDCLFKIRPILSAFADKFREVYCPEEHISIDESLLKFHGRLKFKQYNPSKRSRFGLKLYRLCEFTGQMCGYTWNFKVYSGQDRDLQIPASTKVVLDLSENVLGQGYTIYLDNWYSSPNLFLCLLRQQTHAVGTVRLNRKDMPKNFPGR